MNKKILFFNIFLIFGVFSHLFSMKKSQDGAELAAKRPAPILMGTPLSKRRETMKSSPESTSPLSTLGQLIKASPFAQSPTTPKRQLLQSAHESPKTPLTPGFSRFNLPVFANPEAVFDRLLSYLIKNICEFAQEGDPYISSIKKLFKINNVTSELDFSKLSSDLDETKLSNPDFLLKHISQKITLYKENEDVAAYIKFFCFRKLKDLLKGMKKNSHLPPRKRFRKLVFEDELPSSGDDFQTTHAMPSAQVYFGEEDEATVEDLPLNFREIATKIRRDAPDCKLPFLNSVFDGIKKSGEYSDYLLGVNFDFFNNESFDRKVQAFNFIESIITESTDTSKFYLVYNVLKKFLPVSDESCIKLVEQIFEKSIALIKKNIRPAAMLPYDLKYILLSAKEIMETMKLECDLNLNSIVLIKDDHILNLVYEEKHDSPEVVHLAGGHFEQALNNVVLERIRGSVMQPKVLEHIDVLATCPESNLSYVRFSVATREVGSCTSVSDSETGTLSHAEMCDEGVDAAYSSKSDMLSKESTLFPESIKARCYEYFRGLFDAAVLGSDHLPVQCLINNKGEKRTFYLLRHKISLFNQFSQDANFNPDQDHDVYVVMIIFNEENVNVIWTCYLLGACIIDWDASEEYLGNPVLVEQGISKDFVDERIYAVFTGNTKPEDSEEEGSIYTFDDNNTMYSLISLKNGIYLKIKKCDLDQDLKRIVSAMEKKKAEREIEKKKRNAQKRKERKESRK